MTKDSETTFRERPINIDETGKRKWIYARQPVGKWYFRRTVVGWFAIAFLVLAPFVKINGNPLMLFDIANRKFSIFGQLIWAQDSYILALIMAVTVVFIVLFTVIFGRLWCGWLCPQPVFLEMVYRRIEYLFDGNYRKKRAPNHQSSALTLLKHIVFFIVSIFFANVFICWFTGPERLIHLITSPVNENLSGFLAMLLVSVFYYWIYAFFREQVCTMVCPYGRMQGALVDSKTIAVVYDYKRGEPRGAKNSGDCIDCKQCLMVCPTGIDIRNGSQLECINCTACIDECNSVMEKIKKPANLIRFDSYHGIETGIRSIFNARTYAYSAVLLILIAVLSVTLFNRKPLDTTILRIPGSIYQQVDSKTFSNVFQVKIINKSLNDKVLHLKLVDPKSGSVQLITGQDIVKKQEKLESVLIVNINRINLKGENTPIKLGVYEGETLLEVYSTNFIGPKK